MKNTFKVCPSCKKTNDKVYFYSSKKDLSHPGFRYLKCDCLTIYLSEKNLNAKKLEKFHKKNWFKSSNFQFSKVKNKNIYINNWFKKYKLFNLKKNSNALDIGCGQGFFCLALKKIGIKNIYAFDTDKKNIDKLDKSRINFFSSNFENFNKHKKIKDIKFDYIFLHDVLEHAYDPNDLINSIKKIINKKATIFIKVPNAESLQMEILKEFNWTSYAPYHRTFFSKKGIQIFLKRHKFKKIKFLDENTKSWGWTRGISWKLGKEKYYRELRKSKKFRDYYFYIDNLLEDISLKFEKKPCLFLKTSIK